MSPMNDRQRNAMINMHEGAARAMRKVAETQTGKQRQRLLENAKQAEELAAKLRNENA